MYKHWLIWILHFSSYSKPENTNAPATPFVHDLFSIEVVNRSGKNVVKEIKTASYHEHTDTYHWGNSRWGNRRFQTEDEMYDYILTKE